MDLYYKSSLQNMTTNLQLIFQLRKDSSQQSQRNNTQISVRQQNFKHERPIYDQYYPSGVEEVVDDERGVEYDSPTVDVDVGVDVGVNVNVDVDVDVAVDIGPEEETDPGSREDSCFLIERSSKRMSCPLM